MFKQFEKKVKASQFDSINANKKSFGYMTLFEIRIKSDHLMA